MSAVNIRIDPGKKRFVGTTNNVARIAFDLDIIKNADSVSVVLDNQSISNIPVRTGEKQLWLEKRNDTWNVISKPSLNFKGAHRYGTFKDAFRNQMTFVYGTTGKTEENKWAFEKARYDAEKFWYQGNGSIEIIPDKDFIPSKYPDRNIILYGNHTTNSAWKLLLQNCPIRVQSKEITIGDQKVVANDLSCLFVWPRKDSNNATIGVVSGTGINGMRAINRIPYMSPGIGLPDCTILSLSVLKEGDEGIIMTGFFGLDWSIGNGEFVWNSNIK